MRTYKDLIAWQVSCELVKAIFRLTEKFPPAHRYSFIDQMRRAVLSIPSNIAEGYRRRSSNDFRRFCLISYGSASELETQLLLAKYLGLASPDVFEEPEILLSRTLQLLNRLTASMHPS